MPVVEIAKRSLPAGRIVLALATALSAASATHGQAVEGEEEGEEEEEGEAEPPADAELTEHVTVKARQDDLIGIASSATEGATGAADLGRRPILRPGEIVETIPGVIATQHSGGGKANQYFLRGFNLDHGTDLRIEVDGMLVNLPTHGHGQGYADLNFLVPELVDTVRFRKGSYDAGVGDFSAAGSADVELVRDLEHAFVRVSGGEHDFRRAVAGGAIDAAGGRLLGGFEYQGYDGPWVRPDDFTKLNGLVRYTRGDAGSGFALTALGYDGDWNATDQIPERVAGTTIDRFGLLDPDLRGETSRYSLSGEVHRLTANRSRRLNAWLLDYDLALLSNFTYCLTGGGATSCAIDDDQFLQLDDRVAFGSRYVERHGTSWGGRRVVWGAGAELQLNDIENGLFRTADGQVRPGAAGTIRADDVRQLTGGAFADVEVRWTDRLRTVAGLRADHVDADVESDRGENSGSRDDSILGPKLSLVFGPWSRTELYANYGRGFHSNDARGIVARIDPTTGDPVDPADPLARADTADLGVRTSVLDGLQSTVTLFWIELDSELVFVGDGGTTEPGPPSRRLGLELANFYRPCPWISLDLDVTLTDAELLDVPSDADQIPGALGETVAAGIVLGDETGPSGALRWRYFGAFPLVEDNSVRGDATSLVNGRVSWGLRNGLRFTLDGFNLLDREDADIQYFYASRLPGSVSPSGATEPVAGVEDVHFHPLEPRTFRLGFEYDF
jgi:outer membrane receptor protein involved in Fe transport